MTEEKIPFDYQIFASALRVPGAIARFDKEINPYNVGIVDGLMGVHQLYMSMVAYHKKTNLDIIDPIAFAAWLEADNSLFESLGGAIGINQFVTKLQELPLSDIDSIIKLTEVRGKEKRQIDKSNELIRILSQKGQVSDTDTDRIVQLTEEIRALENKIGYDPLANIRTANDIANDVDNLWNIPPFLPTRFKSLNKAMGYDEDKGGFFRGGVHSVVALSGKGKSTLVKCLCNDWLDDGETVLFLNFEEAQSHWERILMTQIIKKNVYEHSNKLSDKEKQYASDRFRKKMLEWGDRFMVRHDPDSLFFEDIEKWLRDILGHGARKPDVVVIDTIQSMFTKTGGRARWGDFEQIMVGLEKLAKDMDAVFIITAQQNINATKERREEINQSDMGGSVTITQKSTVALFLTPVKDASKDDTIEDTRMQVQIPKNRITGTAFAGNPPIISYDDSIKSYTEYVMETIDTEVLLTDFNNFEIV